ncbi:MAG TPA: type II secretion system F family protein [Mobilitalea sp.]|nr:type II secretion system F family protein [Mobilitalea sp.]
MTENYDYYYLSQGENIIYILQGIVITAGIGILFYQSILGLIFLSPMIYFYRIRKVNILKKERKWKLNLEFRDGILALSAALEAGYSAENAFEEACRDLKQIYQENSLILKEFHHIVHQLNMNITVEKALNDFSERTQVEDILSFSEVFSTAKRTGGDLINVIKITSNMISDKIEVKREIITLITAKRLEANIMKVIPLVILIYLSVSSPGFLDPLYHNLFGVIIMTAFLFCYLVALLIMDKIVAIEV